MNIRTGRIEDAANLETVFETLGYPATTIELRKRMEILLSLPNYSFIVAEDEKIGNEIVGLCGLCIMYDFTHNDPYIRVLALSVLDAYQGQGIGRKLMDAVVQKAKDEDIAMIALNSGNRPERYNAHGFYEHYGFKFAQKGYKLTI